MGGDTVKTVMVTLEVDIPESEMGQYATVTIADRTYAGKVSAIITHEVATVETSEVTLEAAGLKVKP